MQHQQLALQRMTAAGVSSQHVPVRISNHHVHLCTEHVAALFGEKHELTTWKPLRQPGRYAAEEVVTLTGPKGQIENVRVIGPVRNITQVEICGTDQYVLGIQAPVRDSGNFDDTPGITIRGPRGEVHIVSGVIRALRHIHLSSKELRQLHLSPNDVVNVRLHGDRDTVYEGVLIRFSPSAVLEMHIDTDEANLAGIPAQSIAEILGPSFRQHSS
jgi:propanediol utilization protein